MDSKPLKATRAMLAEDMRKHYEFVSNEACDWLSSMPDAIDSWEHEPILQATADRLRGLLREIERSSKTCPLCHGILVWYGTVAPAEGVGHTEDCRLAKELDDTALEDRDG